MKRLLAAGFIVLVALAAWFLRTVFRPQALPEGPRTVDQVLEAIGPTVDLRWRLPFLKAGVSYPPKRMAMLIFKQEKRLEVFAAGAAEPYRFIQAFPILAASGTRGPKFREGDCQVPEGLYRIESLNPNSRFHLSLRISYPNANDISRAVLEGRNPLGLGGDIMIHGSDVSIGCIAMGDLVAENLFVLAARTGIENIRVVMAPEDFRVPGAAAAPAGDEHTAGIYRDVRAVLGEFAGR